MKDIDSMTQVSNSEGPQLVENDERHLSHVLSQVETGDSLVLRNATAKQDPIQELLQRVTAAYSETDLQDMLLECNFRILTYADNGNPDVIEIPIEVLGHSTEVRELNWTHVLDLVMTDEHTWGPLEVCLWPEYLSRLEPAVLLRIISGNHRTSAAKEKGLSCLPVRIFKVEKEIDFRVLAIRSNASHGLNFTEDECKKQAQYLKQEGKRNVEIAKILSKSTSAISRWLTGADSNASRKVGKIVQPQHTDSPSPATSVSNPLVRSVPTVAQKIEALLIGESMSVDAQEAKTYIDTMPVQKKQRVQALQAWLQEVMEG